MFDVFIDALKDCLNMLPLLLIIYIGIELIEYKWGEKIRLRIQRAGHAGPAIGALGGSLPQCGFSVVGATLYTQRLVTIGTLLAIYLSTSDEALPVILSQPDRAGIIIPLIITKIFIAIVAGYSIDFIFRKTNQKVFSHIKKFENGTDNINHQHQASVDNTTACCGHNPNPSTKFNAKEIFLHPLIHTLKVFVYIFIVTLIINTVIFLIGENALSQILAANTIFQPFLAALLGLLPNCASSVAITELYLNGAITYGAVIAGLSASGGLGLLVLFKEDKNKAEVLKIIGLLYGISVLAGLLIQAFAIAPVF